MSERLTPHEVARIEAVTMANWMATPVIEVVEQILTERAERCICPPSDIRTHRLGCPSNNPKSAIEGTDRDA